MKEITKETIDRLYKKQSALLKVCIGIPVASIILDVVLFGSMTWLVFILIIIGMILIAVARKILLPAGMTKNTKEAYRYLQNDYSSDNAVNMLYQKIGQSTDYAEKMRLIYLLSDIHCLRGEYDKALQVLLCSDKSGFDKYCELGMSYYGQLISVYDMTGDHSSVLSAYAEGEQFIDASCCKNYVCCTSALSFMMLVEKARGNYKKALDICLLNNEYLNLFNSTTGASQQGTSIAEFIRGTVFYNTAELFYLNNDYANAGKYLDIGGPMLSKSPSMIAKANELSGKISAALNKTNI